MHVLIFSIVDTSEIVTPFNVQWSHNFAHNCDHATFNVDCCYDILQHLLRICMPTKTSVKFQAIYHPTSSKLRSILRLLTNTFFCRSYKAVVSKGEEQGQFVHEAALPPSHEIRCSMKGNRSMKY